MALIVEDGTGLTNSESYIAVAAADTYFSNRADEIWSGLSTPEKETALRKAAQYLDSTYWNRFSGERVSTAQALAWPRVYQSTDPAYLNQVLIVVPQAVKDAQAELAVRAAQFSLSPDQDRGGAVRSKQVGSISIEYFEGASAGKTFPLVDSILSRVLRGLGGGTMERS